MQTSQRPPEYPDFDTLETERSFLSENEFSPEDSGKDSACQAIFDYYNEG